MKRPATWSAVSIVSGGGMAARITRAFSVAKSDPASPVYVQCFSDRRLFIQASKIITHVVAGVTVY